MFSPSPLPPPIISARTFQERYITVLRISKLHSFTSHRIAHRVTSALGVLRRLGEMLDTWETIKEREGATHDKKLTLRIRVKSWDAARSAFYVNKDTYVTADRQPIGAVLDLGRQMRTKAVELHGSFVESVFAKKYYKEGRAGEDEKEDEEGSEEGSEDEEEE